MVIDIFVLQSCCKIDLYILYLIYRKAAISAFFGSQVTQFHRASRLQATTQNCSVRWSSLCARDTLIAARQWITRNVGVPSFGFFLDTTPRKIGQ